MQKRLFILLAACWLLSCNKDTTEIKVPPFSAYPNPFTNTLGLFISPQSSTNTFNSLQVLDGADKVIFESGVILPGDNLQIDMSQYEKGIYYVQLSGYNLPVLKAE